MQLTFSTYNNPKDLGAGALSSDWSAFVHEHPQGNFFQSPEAFTLFAQTTDYRPVLLIGRQADGAIAASLLAVVQTNGSGLKSWLSRRIIVWGGPLLGNSDDRLAVLEQTLDKLGQYARGSSIFMEIRNFADTSAMQSSFEAAGFEFRPHLNFLVRTDEMAAVRKRMSSSRWRQIKSSRKAGAEIALPSNEQEVRDFYDILHTLYKEKVKKPLPGFDLFRAIWQSPSCKLFLVKREGEVLGGIACPIFADRIIYEWYVCGRDGEEKGLHPSVLATWAPIEYAVENGLDHFDFMGAGKPDQDYGVREFKARFGGEEVAYGRYHCVVNKPLYEIGKLGLEVYQKLS